MINLRKTAAIGLASTTFLMTLAATATPAAARQYHRHYPYWGWGVGAAAAGLALGAAAAAASAGSYYGDNCLASQPIVDVYGNIVGYRRIRVC
jgi:hypothetical protein